MTLNAESVTAEVSDVPFVANSGEVVLKAPWQGNFCKRGGIFMEERPPGNAIAGLLLALLIFKQRWLRFASK
jgi:hypothetical protein